MSEWKPIETAPKDGTEILVWCSHWHGMTPARYERGEHGYTGWEHRTGYGSTSYLSHEPTHWMPLPAPPVTD